MVKTVEEQRADFEMGLLFDDLGCSSFARRPDGSYDSVPLQMAWLGYQMCAKYAHALLARHDPDRYISQGMLNAYEEGGVGDNPENQIRRALQVCGDTPV